jgi:hypothetical protein
MTPFPGLTIPISSTGKFLKGFFLKIMRLMNDGRVVVLGLLFLGQFIWARPTFERDFSPDDPLIQHPHTSEQ